MRRVPVIGVNLETQQTIQFNSIRQFARFLNADQTKRCTAQRRVLSNGGFVTYRGEQWYIERA